MPLDKNKKIAIRRINANNFFRLNFLSLNYKKNFVPLHFSYAEKVRDKVMIHLVFTLFPHSLANLWLLGRNLWTLFPRLYEVYFDFEVIVPLDMITVNTIQQKNRTLK